MEQSIQPASQAELEIFMKAAEEQFAAMGVKPEQAQVLFSSYLAKQAEALNVTVPETADEEKQASAEEAAQMEVFLKSALDRFEELGVPREDAAAYLNAKVAESRPQPSEKVVKLAEHLKAGMRKSAFTPALSAANKIRNKGDRPGGSTIASRMGAALPEYSPAGLLARHVDNQRPVTGQPTSKPSTGTGFGLSPVLSAANKINTQGARPGGSTVASRAGAALPDHSPLGLLARHIDNQRPVISK